MNRRTELMSAALRHIKDAERLADSSQPDSYSLEQAFHLAGFAPECARKACLQMGDADKVMGHDFGDCAEAVLSTWLSLDAHAHRYRPDRFLERYPGLNTWTPESRYKPNGFLLRPRGGNNDPTVDSCEKLLEDARAATDDILLMLWTDGKIDVEVL